MRSLVVTCLLCSAVLGGVSARAEDQEDEARVHFKQGVEFYKARKFEEAATEFTRSYELKPHYKILFNLAQAENELENYAKALIAYLRYQVEGGDEISAERQKEVQSEIDRLNNLVGVIEVHCPVKEAEVSVDDEFMGETPLPHTLIVDVGKHNILVKKKFKELHRQVFRIAGGQRLSINVGGRKAAKAARAANAEQRKRDLEAWRKYERRRIAEARKRAKEQRRAATRRQKEQEKQEEEQAPLEEPEDEEKPKRVWTWVVGGIGLAAGVAAAVTGGVAASREGDLETSCENKQCTKDQWDELDGARALATATDVLIGFAAAGVATGVVLFFVEPELAQKEDVGVAFVPTVGQKFAGASIMGRF